MVDLYARLMGEKREPRRVLITGGSSGIGRATALLFAALGDRVAVTGRQLDALQALAAEAEQRGLPGEILALQADVRDAAAMRQAVTRTVDAFDGLEVVIANAGIGHRGALVEAEWDDLETVLRTNIDGVIHTIRAAVPAMRQTGRGGQIVLVSSILGPVPGAYAAAYSASKAAVDALGRALRGELATDGIAVSVVHAGQTETAFARRRLGQPGRVATRWPTMTPEQVAGGIAEALERQPRTMALRLVDRWFIRLGRWFPGLMDRVLARVYGGQDSRSRDVAE